LKILLIDNEAEIRSVLKQMVKTLEKGVHTLMKQMVSQRALPK